MKLRGRLWTWSTTSRLEMVSCSGVTGGASIGPGSGERVQAAGKARAAASSRRRRYAGIKVPLMQAAGGKRVDRRTVELVLTAAELAGHGDAAVLEPHLLDLTGREALEDRVHALL